MNKNISRLRELLSRYLSGNDLSETEGAELWDYIDDPLFSGELESILEEAFYLQTDEASLTHNQQQQVLNRVFEIRTASQKGKKLVKLWPRIAAGVAASVMIVLLGTYWFRSVNTPASTEAKQVAVAGNIVPGKIGATLTLADGQKISLADISKGQVIKEGGIRIVKTADGQLVYEIKPGNNPAAGINTLSTAPGETYCVTLPDQSKVWLNADSRLTYNAALYGNGRRQLSLEGEAYFEIFKDKAHPFIVTTGAQQVEVLGTHFNISGYSTDASIKTTLLEGSVKVKGNGREKLIKPGQQAALSSGKIEVKTVQAEDAVAWKNGFFVFDNEDLQAVMTKIARWYNITVQFEDPALKKETFYGSVSRFENISTVLKSLERTGVVTFSVKDKSVIVAKKR